MSKLSSFRSIKNKHDIYRSKDCIRTFFKSLRHYATKIILKRKKMKLLTTEQQESSKNGKLCYICQERYENKYVKGKKYRK